MVMRFKDDILPCYTSPFGSEVRPQLAKESQCGCRRPCKGLVAQASAAISDSRVDSLRHNASYDVSSAKTQLSCSLLNSFDCVIFIAFAWRIELLQLESVVDLYHVGG